MGGFNPLGAILILMGVGCLYMGIFGTYKTVLSELGIPGFTSQSSQTK